MNRATRDRLILFTRYPEPGRTKTRLIPVLGAAAAASLQRAMTAHTFRVARSLCARTGARLEVRFDGAEARTMRRWLGRNLNCQPQGKGDLGARLSRAFDAAFASGDQRVVVVGCDSPDLEVSLLAQAFHALDQVDLVLGPARDGGYYLVGLKRASPALFREIQWGSELVLGQTLQAAAGHRLRHMLLPELDDVDRPDDLPVWDRAQRRASTLAVIIPTLNEASALPATLRAVMASSPQEVIVVDGGSEDSSVELARAAGARVISASRGRATQLNAGARATIAAQLLFLHADTLPPPGYADIVRRTLADPRTCAGAFAFAIREPMRHRRLVETLVAARCRLLRNPFGDQGLFLHCDLFEAVGGYPDWPILEDVGILRRLKPHGRLAITPETASTSGRRWLTRGVARTFWLNLRIMIGYHRGVSLEHLARNYRQPH